jgi:hypothetical protein
MPVNTIKSEAGIELIEITRMGGSPIALLERSYRVVKNGVADPYYLGTDIGRAESAFASTVAHQMPTRPRR